MITLLNPKAIVFYMAFFPLFVDPATGDGAIVMADATTGLDTDGVPAALLTGAEPAPVEPWVPTDRVPDWAIPVLGFWFWGNTATEWRWQGDRLEVRMLQTGTLAYAFAQRGDIVLNAQGCLGICNGVMSYFLMERGVTRFRTRECTKAWKVR